MIAALPMYDMPPVMAANDRLWALIRDGLRRVGERAPDHLTRDATELFAQWSSPDLVLSQTCGLPFRSRLHDKVARIGTPDYGLDGCPPGHYRSVFIVHQDDPRSGLDDFDGADLAYNEAVSQSGWAAPLNHVAGLGRRLRPALETGAHRQSLVAVAERRAPLAALDLLSWDILKTFHPAAGAVKTIGLTEPTPGLPYIAAQGTDVALWFGIIATAIADLHPTDRAATRLRGFVDIPTEAYLAVPTPAAA
jgi:ABC-type phosphate/phosphonate transport system substrate-binding protein